MILSELCQAPTVPIAYHSVYQQRVEYSEIIMSSKNSLNSRLMWLMSVAIAFALFASCSSSGRGWPIVVNASISPEPIVGQEVTWHIEISSNGPALLNTKLYVFLPEQVELISGDADWQGDIPANGSVSVDLVIRVNEPGEWMIDAYAFTDYGTGNGGEGGGKTLYIASTLTEAKVTDETTHPVTPIPSIQFIRASTPTP